MNLVRLSIISGLLFGASSLFANNLKWSTQTSYLLDRVATDSQDDVLAVGTGPGNADVSAMKFASTNGAPLWSQTVAQLAVLGMAVDSSDNLILCGGTPSGSAKSILTSIRPDGTIAWRRESDIADRWCSVTVDSSRIIWVVGSKSDGAPPASWVARYSPAGDLLSTTYVATNPNPLYMSYLEKDDADNVYSLTSSQNAVGKRFATLAKFNPNGVRQWLRYFGRNGNPYAYEPNSFDLAVEPNGTANISYVLKHSGLPLTIYTAKVNTDGVILENPEHNANYGWWFNSMLRGSTLEVNRQGELMFIYGTPLPEESASVMAREVGGVWTHEMLPNVGWDLPRGILGSNSDRYMMYSTVPTYGTTQTTTYGVLTGPTWSHSEGPWAGYGGGFYRSASINSKGDVVATLRVSSTLYLMATQYRYFVQKFETYPGAVNDPAPSSVSEYRCQIEGEVTPATSLLANDYQVMQGTAELSVPASRGTVTVQPNGRFTYRSNPSGIAGADTFEYRAFRGSFGSVAQATVVVVPNLTDLTLSPAVITGGNPLTVQVAIEQTPNMAFDVQLSESSLYLDLTSVQIASGQTTGRRQFATLPVTTRQLVKVGARLGTKTLLKTVTINP